MEAECTGASAYNGEDETTYRCLKKKKDEYEDYVAHWAETFSLVWADSTDTESNPGCYPDTNINTELQSAAPLDYISLGPA